MNEDKNYIDRIFEQELKDFAPDPGPELWAAISAGLDAKDAAIRRRRTIIRWTSFSAAMIAVAVFLFVRSCSVNGTDSLNIVKKRTERLNLNNNSILLTANEASISNIDSNLENSISSEKVSRKKHKRSHKSSNSSALSSTAQKTRIEALHTNAASQDLNKTDGQISIETIEYRERIFLNKFFALNPFQSFDVTMNESTPYFIFKSRKSIGIQAEAGAGLMFLSVNSKPDFQYDNPVVVTAEPFNSPVSEYFLNVKLQYSRLYAKVGLNISQYYQNNNYSIPYTTIDTSGGYASFDLNKYWTYDTIGYFHDPYDPDILYPIVNPTYHIDTVGSVWNSKYVERQNIKKTNSTQRYHFAEIPISLGYQYQLGKIGIFGDMGIGFAFLYKSSGYYSDGVDYYEISKENNPYRKTHANLLINAGVNYPLGNQWNIFAQGSLRTNISPIYKAEQFKDLRYNAFGLRLGLSYNLK